MLGQDYAMNSNIKGAFVMMNNNKISSKKNAVILQKMTTLDRIKHWNEIFKNPPKNGFIVFDTDENDYFFFNGKAWERVLDVSRDNNGKQVNQNK